MKNVFLSLVFLSICCLVSAQTCKISGILIDKMSDKPIPYANAILKSPVDSTFFMGTITDEIHFS